MNKKTNCSDQRSLINTNQRSLDITNQKLLTKKLMDNEENILLVNKPKGITSFDVIRKLRKELGIKKMGHSGTLDPMATGLMIIGINKGTKKLKDFIGLDKIYKAEITFGKRTDSYDLDGKILEEIELNKKEIDKINENIDKILNELTGELEIEVPIYSAIKRNGKKLYEYARSGKEIELPKKKMTIYYIKKISEIKKENKYILNLELKVSSGTYIRSIVNEINKKTGIPCVLSGLNRTQIGEYKLKDAIEL
jgi:tRNA pseudouridine55 synthase